jgi:hypothetical protein
MVASTVFTVSVGVPFPPVTVAELKLHLGGTAVAGVTAQPRVTVELKPSEGATVTVDVAESPGVMVAGVSAVAVNSNDGAAAITVKLAVVVWTRAPEVPVTVKLKLPLVVDEVVVTVSGALTCPLPGGTETDAGEQEAPEGSPEQVTATVPVNPACGFT